MVVWCTQDVHQDCNSFMWNQLCNSETALYVHHFGGYSKCTVKSYSQSLKITCNKSTVNLLESGELCYLKVVTTIVAASEPVWPSGKALGW